MLSLFSAAVVVFVLLRLIGSGPGMSGPSSSRDTAGDKSTGMGIFGMSLFSREELDLKKVLADDPALEQVIEIMKERYGKKLSNKRLQIKLLGGLIRHLKKKHPYDWQQRIKVIIAAEFPEYSVELADKLEKLEEYNAYLREHREEFRALGPDAKKEKMLARGREIFGSEGDEIWERELQEGRIDDMIRRMDGNPALSLNDKLQSYNNLAKELYPEESDKSSGKTGDEVMVRTYDFSNKFLSMVSVQSELSGMDPADRARFLKRMRVSMGFNDDVIKKMEDVDRLRDELWAGGNAYNNESNEISSRFNGEERDRRIDEARRKYFGRNADLIKYEEETFRFYRFTYPRRWGID